MTNNTLFGFVAFVIAVLVSRIIGEKALRQLSAEDKARLVDSFSNYRIINMAVMLSLVVLFIAATRFYPQMYASLTTTFFLSFIVLSVVMSVLNYRRLKGLNLPSRYIKSYLIGLGLQYIGIGFLFAPFIAQYRF